MEEKAEDNFYIFEISTARFSSKILTILDLELEKKHQTPDLKIVGQSLVGFISKKLKKGLINIDEASTENYKIQLHFLQETDFDLDGYNLDDVYQLARQNIVGNYEKEKQTLKTYLLDCEMKLNELLTKYGLI